MSPQSNEQLTRHYEREAEATRNSLASSLNDINERLTPGQLFDEVLTYAKGGGGTFARAFSNAVRENPLPSLLIGTGFMMFLSERTGITRRADAGYARARGFASCRHWHATASILRGRQRPQISRVAQSASRSSRQARSFFRAR